MNTLLYPKNPKQKKLKPHMCALWLVRRQPHRLADACVWHPYDHH